MVSVRPSGPSGLKVRCSSNLPLSDPRRDAFPPSCRATDACRVTESVMCDSDNVTIKTMVRFGRQLQNTRFARVIDRGHSYW